MKGFVFPLAVALLAACHVAYADGYGRPSPYTRVVYGPSATFVTNGPEQAPAIQGGAAPVVDAPYVGPLAGGCTSCSSGCGDFLWGGYSQACCGGHGHGFLAHCKAKLHHLCGKHACGGGCYDPCGCSGCGFGGCFGNSFAGGCGGWGGGCCLSGCGGHKHHWGHKHKHWGGCCASPCYTVSTCGSGMVYGGAPSCGCGGAVHGGAIHGGAIHGGAIHGGAPVMSTPVAPPDAAPAPAPQASPASEKSALRPMLIRSW